VVGWKAVEWKYLMERWMERLRVRFRSLFYFCLLLVLLVARPRVRGRTVAGMGERALC
jgi:hypothetical protein